MGKELDKLAKQAAAFGLNFEAVFSELKQEILQSVDISAMAAKVAEKIQSQPPVDIAALAKQISLDVETKIGLKLGAAIDELQKGAAAGKIDSSTITNGVAQALQPLMLDAINKGIQAQFEAHSKALMTEVYRQLETKQEEFKAQIAEGISQQGPGQQPQQGGKLDIQQVLEAIKMFTQPQQAIQSFAQEKFTAYITGFKDGNKAKVAGIDPDAIMNSFNSVVNSNGQPPTPPTK